MLKSDLPERNEFDNSLLKVVLLSVAGKVEDSLE